MARYSQLTKDIRSTAPECPKAEIEQYARRAVIQFCKESRAWREDLQVDLEQGKGEYTMRVRPEGRVDQVLHAVYVTDDSRRPLKHEPYGRLSVTVSDAQPAAPRHFGVNPAGTTLKVFPEPGGTGFDAANNPRAMLRIVAVPTRNSRQFPDFLHEQYFDGLVSGALWKLLSVPEKPWTNGELAGYHRRQFFLAVRSARQAATAEGWAPMRPKYRRWV